MMTDRYHYTECGLDNVWLEGGFESVDLPSGKHLKIRDVEGLHKEIGRFLIDVKKNLTGKEIRFLRQEMLLSQANLAKLLEVAEQTVHRWEKAKAEIPKPAEALIRLLYRQSISEESRHINIKDKLERLAALEDAVDGQKMTARKKGEKDWKMELPLAL